MRRLRRLVQKRSLRWSEGTCVLEGPDLVAAALDSGQEFEAIYLDQAAEGDEAVAPVLARAERQGVRCFTLASGALARVADARTPQPILAAVRFRPGSLADLPATGFTIVLHDVRDPGNCGTVIRSADAAGADGVILTGQSVDPFNPKTLRATAGSIFHLPVVVGDLGDALDDLRGRGARVWAAVASGGTPLATVDLGGCSAVVIGNESAGLDADALAMCDATLSIPMVGWSESLNLGVAASLILFEALRQREGPASQSAPPSLGGS
ncbi:MAG: RNA methyltransferase [Acidobacteriota bacterium]|nr:RNA methyltransferase [Acidobacteriota bacterium]